MTALAILSEEMPRLALNLIGGGLILAAALAAAARLGTGVPARLRYLTALAAFALAVAAPIGWTLLPAGVTMPAQGAERPATAAQAIAAARQDLTMTVANYSRPTLALLLAVIWAAVAAALIAREAAGHAAIARRRRHWTAAGPAEREALRLSPSTRLYLSDEDGPAAVGLVRPAMVMPRLMLEALPPATLRCIARHELAHLRWCDPSVHAGLRVVRALLWPSLGLWWIERIVRAEREAAADEAAAASAGRADCAEALLAASTWARSSRGSEWMLASAWGSQTEKRILRLLREPNHVPFRALAAALALACGIALAAAAPIGAARGAPPPLAVPGSADPAYRAAAAAFNAVAARTEYRNHVADAAALSRLHAFRRAGNVQPLADALAAPDPRLRETAAWFAGELGDPALTPRLITALRDPDRHTAQASAWALGRIGDRRAAAALLAATGDRRADVRHGAAWALGQMRIGGAAARLGAMERDEDADVRHAARWSLARLEG